MVSHWDNTIKLTSVHCHKVVPPYMPPIYQQYINNIHVPGNYGTYLEDHGVHCANICRLDRSLEAVGNAGGGLGTFSCLGPGALTLHSLVLTEQLCILLHELVILHLEG